jgi:hypothetical protein
MKPSPLSCAVVALSSTTLAQAEIVVLDQIGDGPFDPQALSSSQFPPGVPESAITTVDNFSLLESVHGGAVRVTSIQATVAGLSEFMSFELVDSWTIQVYSSLEGSYESLTGDVYSASFDFPSTLTKGFAHFFGSPVELATFDVDFILPSGDYWMTVAMGNDFAENGVVGIAGSFFGDGPAWFSGPGIGDAVPLGSPAGYRILGEAVPGPAGLWLLVPALVVRRRRRVTTA